MPLITEEQLAQLRRLNEDTLPDRATIRRFAAAKATDRQPGGTVTQTPAVVATKVPCRVSSPGGSLAAAAGGLLPGARCLVVFTAGQDVADADWIDVTLKNGDTLALEALNVDAPRTNEAMRRVPCKLQGAP